MVFALANFKGGVGKTSACLNIGHALQMEGYKVLLIDADAQSNLTFSLGIYGELENTLYHILKRQAAGHQTDFSEVIFNIRGLALIPASLELATADMQFGATPNRERMMKRAFSELTKSYDVVLIDCPPSMGLITQNALELADFVLIPTLAEFLPVKGIEIFMKAVFRFSEQMENTRLKVGGIIVCQYDGGHRILSRELMQELQTAFPDIVFKSHIRRNVAVSEAQALGQSVIEYAPESHAAQDYKSLAAEMIERFTN